MVMSWHGALGPMLARFEAWTREDPVFVHGLGHAGADLPVPPALWVHGEGIVVVWCEDDGAWASSCTLTGERTAEPARVLDGVSRIALARGRRDATLFGADGRGLVSIGLDPRGVATGDPARHVDERRPPAQLTAARLQGESLCVAIHEGAREWTLVACRGGAGTTVRHRHAGTVDDARIRAVGTRAALLLAGSSGVELALVGGGGKVIERPHGVFERGVTGLDAPDAVWSDDHWVVLARDAKAGVIRVEPLAAKGAAFTLPRCDGAFSAGYYSQHYYALEIEPSGDDAELRLWRCTKTGDHQQQRVDVLVNPDAKAARQRRVVRAGLGSLADRLGMARGYRDAASRPTLSRDGAVLELLDETGRLTVAARPDPSGGLAVRVASALGDDPELTEAPSSLVRLAAWVKLRLSAKAREALEARHAWAVGLADAIEATVHRVDRAGHTLVLELRMGALPEPERFLRWLEQLRESQKRAP